MPLRRSSMRWSLLAVFKKSRLGVRVASLRLLMLLPKFFFFASIIIIAVICLKITLLLGLLFADASYDNYADLKLK